MNETVVVGLDASDNAAAALAWARSYAATTHADLVAVHALGLLERTATGRLQPSQRHRQEITHRYEAMAREVPAVVRDGEPVDALLAEARALGATLIVVGTRGEGNASVSSLGSTSAQLVLRSECPVVVVPLG